MLLWLRHLRFSETLCWGMVKKIEAVDTELRLIGGYGEIILWSYSYMLANNSFSVLESSSILNGFCKNPSKSHPKPSPF